ncbi:unnamed protein product [Psylliodes chrysocephalus]|uniref:Protein stoned-B n=1 Tax=Psylliodes chrysocephalus TaxID=3402493 RepID=A0A9P0CV24_9CUCU|nr:unnamed protein product [Psylliodes chrysocephala]
MAANPFLFSEEPYTSPSSAGSNPFLLDDGDDQLNHASGFNDNPFLSQTATTMSTNPFSFDPMELEPAEAEIPNMQAVSSDFGQFTEANNQPSITDFGSFGKPVAPDLFSDHEIQPATANYDQFGIQFNEPATIEPIHAAPIISTTAPQKPSDLDLKYSHQANINGPPRPPPPRPPPSKETQDLLMSVMGAMDATSSSLLGKIPPTRSPSPVNMRDLHSPSPTPEPAFGDLLDVSDKPQETNNTADTDFFSLNESNNCDINQNPQNNVVDFNQPPPVPSQVKPPKPPPPVRPPKPPPPAVISHASKPVPPKAEIKSNIVDDMDMFGVDEPPKKKEVTNADILNLYNAPKQEAVKDLLSDDIIEPEIQSKQEIITVNPVEDVKIIENPKTALSPITQTNDTLISSEHSQEDLQMDLSDNHSKGSVGSVTFNPFAATEDFSSPNIVQQNATDDNFKTEINQNTEQNPMEITENINNFVVEAIPTQNEPFGFSAVENNSIKSEPFGFSTVENNSIKSEPFGFSTVENNSIKSEPFGFSAVENNSTQFTNTSFVNDSAPDVFGLSKSSTVPPVSASATDNFGFGSALPTSVPALDSFGFGSSTIAPASSDTDAFGGNDDFDDFEKKFDSVKHDDLSHSAWGSEFVNTAEASSGFGQDGGFGQDDGFDAFLAMQEPPTVPQSTPNRISKTGSQESDEDKDFSVFIRPKGNDDVTPEVLPFIAPPPATVAASFGDTSPRFNPFDNQTEVQPAIVQNDIPYAGDMKRSDSQETPPTPLYDDDTSQPLEPFPRINFDGEGWEMHLRQPNKKKITGQRFWKKIFVKLQHLPDCVLLQLYNQKDDKDPFQELPLQPCYSVSDIGAQQYDQFGKIFTVKLQYIFYKERPGVRPGQVKKAERITNKLSQFAAYAIQGDYQGVKEFGSDLKKLGLPVEHAPQVSQLMKIGSLSFEDLKQFSFCIEEALFKLQAHRDRALHYKMEEVQITAVDELYVEQESDGHIERQIARVRLFFLGFLTGMPDVELGINDMRRQGKEVVGRHDIIPVETEEWIRLEDVEFHSCIQQEDYELTHIIKFKPPDACYIELLRFRVRPPKNRELPLQLKAQICVTGYKVELRADVLVPGFASRKLGQVPCEDVMIRFPIPECWIYLFRVEKHFRYGSVKSAHRRTGKIKGIERILGTMETLQENLIEVTSGQAKYEHQHRAIVWRCPRLPKEGQGAYTTHNMVCRIALTSYDQMPEKLAEYCFVEFTMPATQVSHTTCRSVSLQNSDSDDPPEKYVRYLARHEYRVGIEHTEGDNPNPYATATHVTKPAPAPVPAPPVNIPPKVVEESSSDSD